MVSAAILFAEQLQLACGDAALHLKEQHLILREKLPGKTMQLRTLLAYNLLYSHLLGLPS